MPRGTRAVPAAEAELHTNLHHEGGRTHTFVSPAVEVLDVTCWCEATIVRVPQGLVRWEGATMSCGRWDCTPPDGEAQVIVSERVMTSPQDTGKIRVGGYLTTLITERYERSEWAERQRERRHGYIVRVLPPSNRTPSQRAPRKPDPKVAERRDRVAVLWRAGKRVRDIADELDVPGYIIAMDVQRLQHAGTISRRNGLKSSA